MKLLSNFIVFIIFCTLILHSCTKTQNVYVPTDPQISGSLTFNGDTTYVNSQNITIRYNSSSPCAPSNEVFYFKVTTTSYPSNAEYEWDFGEGHTAKGQFVQFAYAYEHVYTLTLKVWVNGVNVQQITTAIHPFGQNVSPIASFGSQRNNYLDPNYIAFNAQSSVTSGSIVSYHWNWKDGTTSTVATSYTEHRFPEIPKDSTYQVELTVTSHAGCQKKDTNDIFIPAKYNGLGGISYTKTNACLADSQVFTFKQDANNLPTNAIFEWDFGDGKGLFYGNPVNHSFTYSKTYPVVCTIKVNGNIVAWRNISPYALGNDIKPTAYINSIKNMNPPSNTSWEFAGWGKVGDGHIIKKLVWNYGDGVIDSSNSPYAAHVYAPPIIPNTKYFVKLTVTASSGCIDSIAVPITIP